MCTVTHSTNSPEVDVFADPWGHNQLGSKSFIPLLTWGGNRAIDAAAVEPTITECRDGTNKQCVVATVTFSHTLVADPLIPATEAVIAAIEGLPDIILAGYVPSAH